MPVLFKSGGGKCWAQWGEDATTRYEYRCGNESSKGRAYNKALRQGIAIEISKGKMKTDPSQISAQRDQYQETYNDYPKAASENAKRALDWIEKYGRDVVDAGTRVGLARANQLAKGEPISRDTIARMAAFNRHRKNSQIDPKFRGQPHRDRGYVSWLLWGGTEGVDWAIRKLAQIDKE